MNPADLHYSPKLRRVIDEMKEILVREDIAGVIILHDIVSKDFEQDNFKVDGRAEYLVHVNPTYSQLIPTKGGFRFRDKAEDHPNEIQRTLRMTASYNLVEMLAEVTGQIAISLIDLSTKIKSNIRPGKPGKFHERE